MSSNRFTFLSFNKNIVWRKYSSTKVPSLISSNDWHSMIESFGGVLHNLSRFVFHIYELCANMESRRLRNNAVTSRNIATRNDAIMLCVSRVGFELSVVLCISYVIASTPIVLSIEFYPRKFLDFLSIN
jgi:hypothetical protein